MRSRQWAVRKVAISGCFRKPGKKLDERSTGGHPESWMVGLLNQIPV